MNEYQGTYTAAPAAAYAGQNLETEFENIRSMQIETAAVGFGLAVGQGSADSGAKLGGGAFVGITVADKTRINGNYQVGDTAGILNKGYIWVTASVALAVTDTLYYVPATGAITNTPNSAANPAIPNSKVISSAGVAGLALIFLG